MSKKLLLMVFALTANTGCFTSGKFTRDVAEATAPEKLELPPKDGAKACLATAEMLEKNGQVAEAAALYEKARALDPANVGLARRLAVLHDRQGSFVQADEEYRRALSLAPRDADLWCDQGYSFYCRGKWDEAEDALRKAIELKADHKRAWNNLGLTLAQAGKFAESFEAFSHVVPAAQAHCNLGFALAAQGKTADAIYEYKKALELSPDLPIAQAAVVKLEAPKKPKALPTPKPAVRVETAAVELGPDQE